MQAKIMKETERNKQIYGSRHQLENKASSVSGEHHQGTITDEKDSWLDWSEPQSVEIDGQLGVYKSGLLAGDSRVDNVNGYVSLFPMLLRTLHVDSVRLTAILEQLDNETELWSPYGLRSLSPISPYYEAYNTLDSAPYWRGQVWISCNYLALDALRFYASKSPESLQFSSEIARKNVALAGCLYTELRRRLIATVSREFQRTGTFWEHYNDHTGAGEGTRPFSGWTALIVNILTEHF